MGTAKRKRKCWKNLNGYKDDLGLNHEYTSGFAYESEIKPLLSPPIKGVI